eukprot:978175-Pyramimonas_sp.AAC.1
MPDFGTRLRRSTDVRGGRANRGGRVSGQCARAVRMYVPSLVLRGSAENAQLRAASARMQQVFLE